MRNMHMVGGILSAKRQIDIRLLLVLRDVGHSLLVVKKARKIAQFLPLLKNGRVEPTNHVADRVE